MLSLACKYQVSDIFIKTGSIPRMRHRGKIILIQGLEALSPEAMESIVDDVMPKRLLKELVSTGDVDFSFKHLGTYFRANLYREQNNLALVLRLIKSEVPTFEELRLPDIIASFAKFKTGLILVTGATGSGKSSTLASLVQYINAHRSCHIVTIEDPIEYRFKEAFSTVSQREIGVDAKSFPSALRASLRQSPDVILVGELRDRETTEVALTAAETGHLVLSTMHTNDSVSTLSRMMSYFEPSKHA
ncbi:MAG: ATPase, T2SS/T4P/T4SS family [Pseudomonadota bacterium]|nr:ATPase, T2SS/T4P/T4SS family [Pseudomonadota bacterium]